MEFGVKEKCSQCGKDFQAYYFEKFCTRECEEKFNGQLFLKKPKPREVVQHIPISSTTRTPPTPLRETTQFETKKIEWSWDRPVINTSQIIDKTKIRGRLPTIELYKILVENGREIKCEICGVEKWLTIHHVDGDPMNSNPVNLKILCWNHHLGDFERKGATKERILASLKKLYEANQLKVNSIKAK